MGTKFIATEESMAPHAYKAMLVRAKGDDVMLTRAFTGLETNMLRPSILAAGLDPANLPQRGMIDVSKDIDIAQRNNRPERWRDIWSAGHSVCGVSAIMPAAELIARTTSEYQDARRTVGARLRDIV
jgi:nitronate monooxygenase